MEARDDELPEGGLRRDDRRGRLLHPMRNRARPRPELLGPGPRPPGQVQLVGLRAWLLGLLRPFGSSERDGHGHVELASTGGFHVTVPRPRPRALS